MADTALTLNEASESSGTWQTLKPRFYDGPAGGPGLDCWC